MALHQVAGKKVGHIVVYALSTCPQCQRARHLLDSLGLGYYFENVDLLSEDDKRNVIAEVTRWNPIRTFPTIVINNKQVIVGFNDTDIRKLALL